MLYAVRHLNFAYHVLQDQDIAYVAQPLQPCSISGAGGVARCIQHQPTTVKDEDGTERILGQRALPDGREAIELRCILV